MDCRKCQDLVLEWLEELLELPESAELSSHLETCSSCQSARDRAQMMRAKVRAAITTPYPDIQFSSPEPFQIGPRENLPDQPRRSWRVETVLAGIAAALAVLAGSSLLRDMATRRNIESGRAALAANGQQTQTLQENLNSIRQARQGLVDEYSRAVAKVREEANSRPVRVVVNGPAGVVGGAPTQFLAQAIDPSGRTLPMRMEASLENPGDKAIALDVLPQADGTHRISVPPDVPLRPGIDPMLRVRAFPPGDSPAKDKPLSMVEVTERIKLGLPPLTTHLTTDKRLYQPGETVRYRSLTLDRASLQAPQGALKLRVRLISPNKSERLLLVSDGLMAQADLPAKPVTGPSGKPLRGIAAGEIPLDNDSPGGEYVLRVEDADGRFVPAERKFLVQVYQKPRINKELTFSKRGYAPGETLQFAVRATAPDGAPIANQPVKAQLKLDDQVVEATGAITKDLTRWFESTLGPDGRATFSFKLPEAAAISKGDGSITVSFSDGASVETLVKPVPLVLERVDVGLFPESGDLVAGLPARVYFTARTSLGKPTDLKARLLENGRPLVEGIQTRSDLENPGANQGMGSFEFTPKTDASYTLELLGPSKGTTLALPATKAAGVTLRVDGEKLSPGGKVPVELRATGEGLWFLGLYCRGRLLDSKLVPGKESRLELDPPAGIGGVCRLTAFRLESPAPGTSGKGKLTPVAERLIWRPVASNLNVDLKVELVSETGSPGKAMSGPFKPGEKVRLNAKVRDTQGNPTGAILLASVVDHAVVTLADEKTARSMPTHFLLGEEILHPDDLEYADFLLTPHPLARVGMDLLLGTQGWRRFAEQDPAKFQAQHPVEAPHFLVSSGLARQQSTLSTQTGLENKIRNLAPEFDDRFRKQEEDVRQARIQLEELFQKGRDIQSQLNLVEGRLGQRFTLLTGGLGLGLGMMSFLFWLGRGKTLATRLALGLGVPALLGFGVIWLFSPGMEGLSKTARQTDISMALPTASPMANAAPKGIDHLPPEVLRNDRWAKGTIPAPRIASTNPPGGPIKSQNGPKLLADANNLADAGIPRPGTRVGGSPPNPEGRARAKQAPGSALLGAARRPGMGGDNLLGPIDRLSLPRAIAEDPQLLPSVSGEDLPPLEVVREYSHIRFFGEDPSSRSDFSETLLWKPVWVLPTGEGNAEFELSDSVTRFVATVSANTEDGRLASASQLFESKQPLTLSIKLPGEATAGDLLEAPLTLEGEPGSSVDWAVPQIDGAELRGPNRGTLTLDSNGRGRVLVPLRPSENSSLVDYRLEASSGTWRDTMRGKMPVVSDGFPVTGSLSMRLEGKVEKTLRLPDTWKKDSLSLRVEGFPSPLGEALSGLEGMLREPHGCFEQTSSSSYPNLMVLRLLKTSGVANPEVESKARELLAAGYKRLVGFECMDTKAGRKHGFEWFGAADQQHEGLTAYGLLQFTAMRDAGLEGMDPGLISRTREFLVSKRDGQGGFVRSNRRVDSFGNSAGNLTNAYILWALAKSGDVSDLKTEFDALAKRAPEINDPYEMALVANALLASGRKDSGASLCRQLIQKQSPDGSIPGAATSITHSMGNGLVVETTALAVQGWLASKDPASAPTVLKAIKWLAQKRSGGTFGSTQATILALEAMTRFQESQVARVSAGTFRFSTQGKPVAALHFPENAITRLVGDFKESDSGLRPGDNLVTLELTQGNSFPCSLTWEYLTLTPPTSPKASIHIQVQPDRQEVLEGESVRLDLRVKNRSSTAAGMVMAVIGIPSGLSLPPDAKQLIELTRPPSNGGEPRLAAWEQRGRELAFYWRSMNPDQELQIPVDLVASVPGQTTGPACRSYQYYSPDDKFWQKGLSITVKPKN